ncbi:MAG TPA: hypothetical protein VNT26_13670 [Candidatus Sulfotelmatobacter sp.]|nr:hypothetical protein [Candidatus Sulfotelmatobacter sp.]
MSYLDNGCIRVGMDLNLGGAITYLSPSGTNQELNLINGYDWGRQVQVSYYSGPVPFQPPGTCLASNWAFLGWNPIQSGDCYGHESRVVEHVNDGHTLYVKCIPMQWPMDNVPGECECEVWLQLEGAVVKARCRLTNHRSDHTQYHARDQELPAVYVNGPFYRLMTYTGEQPFTGGALTRIEKRPGEPGMWSQWTATEQWAALVNDAGWGLGVWHPETLSFLGGFAGQPGQGGPLDNPTGYIAPLHNEILDHNIVYEYCYELMVGTLEQIRAHVYRRTPHSQLPEFRFEHSRQGWFYEHAIDKGWPVRGELDVQLSGEKSHVLSPVFFVRAAEAPKMVLEAAFDTGQPHAMVRWRNLDQKALPPDQYLVFPVVADGQFRRYEVNLASATNYHGTIVQLRLDPISSGSQPGRLRLKSVAFQQ